MGIHAQSTFRRRPDGESLGLWAFLFLSSLCQEQLRSCLMLFAVPPRSLPLPPDFGRIYFVNAFWVDMIDCGQQILSRISLVPQRLLPYNRHVAVRCWSQKIAQQWCLLPYSSIWYSQRTGQLMPWLFVTYHERNACSWSPATFAWLQASLHYVRYAFIISYPSAI